MKRSFHLLGRCIASVVIASIVAGCSGGNGSQSSLPSTTNSSVAPAIQALTNGLGKLKNQTSGQTSSAVALFSIPAPNGASYNVSQWSAIAYPATDTVIVVGTDAYNDIVYSFTVTGTSASNVRLVTSDGLSITQNGGSNTPTTMARGINPARDKNLLTVLGYDLQAAQGYGGGPTPGKPGGPVSATKSLHHPIGRLNPNLTDHQAEGIGKVLVCVGAVIVLIAFLPAVAPVAAIVGAWGALIGLEGAVLDIEAYAGVYGDGNNGPAPTVDPPSGGGAPSLPPQREKCVDTPDGLYCTFYY